MTHMKTAELAPYNEFIVSNLTENGQKIKIVRNLMANKMFLTFCNNNNLYGKFFFHIYIRVHIKCESCIYLAMRYFYEL